MDELRKELIEEVKCLMRNPEGVTWGILAVIYHRVSAQICPQQASFHLVWAKVFSHPHHSEDLPHDGSWPGYVRKRLQSELDLLIG